MGFLGGPLVINTIGGSAVVNFGGALFVSPKNVAKNANGAGGGHTAAISFSFTGPSFTNTAVTDLVDQPVVLNN